MLKQILAVVTFVSAGTVGAAAQQSDFASLQTDMVGVTEEALAGGVPEGPVVVGQDCEVSSDDVATFDAALELSDSEQQDALDKHAALTLPDIAAGEQLLFQNDYVIVYSDSLKVPLLASYVLTKADIRSRTRENCFREDNRLEGEARSTLSDYAEPLFDRGHLVPRADMNRSREAMVNTFVLSNMMPQHDDFNQGVWETLETAVRAWAKSREIITVATGAVFDADGDGQRDADDNAERVQPDGRVGIPTAYYKIVLHEQPSGFVEAIAILMPHTNEEVPEEMEEADELAYIQDHIVTIDEIEAVTGFDFFSALSDTREEAVERSIASGLWQ